MILYTNGKIYNGETMVNEFAVENGKFIQIQEGQEYEKVVDLKGQFVLPGFIDSHMHLLSYGKALISVPLQDSTTSLQSVLDALKERLDEGIEEGMWLEGRGWNHDYFLDEQRFPTRYDLDKVSKDVPICITRCCGHVSVVNSKAISMMNLPENLQLDDGQIDVDENGVPNGIFRENAINFISEVKPEVTKEAIKQMLLKACQALNSFGITSCHSDDFKVFDIDYKIVMEAFNEIKDQMSVRVNEQAQLNKQELVEFLEAGYTTNSGDELFKIGPLKMLGDGSLGARTAYMKDPYADDPTTRGIPIFTFEQFKEMIELAHSHHMGVAIHSIGDQTFQNIIDAYEYVLNKYPDIHNRHGIIHCQITSKDMIDQFAKLGLHAYVQSIFLDYDIHIVEDRVGKKAEESYQFMNYLNHGCHVSNGSDCPVELPNVLKGMQCAITRCNASGDCGPYLLEEACDIKTAIASFTSEGAYASFEENTKGKILPGFVADFVVLDQNILEIDPHELVNVKILETYFNGNKVFELK